MSRMDKQVSVQTDKYRQKHSPIGYTLNVTDGTIQEQTCHYNITFSQYAMQCNAMQYSNAMQCNAM
jgi:hypothetical protein